MPHKNQISLKIDKLTDSLQNAKTGESFATDFCRATARDLAKTKNWLFDWRREATKGEVYKLFLKDSPREIEGLVSLQDRGDHIWANLAEAAPHNLGRAKRYVGVGGSLFAIAVKISFNKGYDGFVDFEAKTELVAHYRKALGAVQIGRSTRMIIETEAALRLHGKYFTNN